MNYQFYQHPLLWLTRSRAKAEGCRGLSFHGFQRRRDWRERGLVVVRQAYQFLGSLRGDYTDDALPQYLEAFLN